MDGEQLPLPSELKLGCQDLEGPNPNMMVFQTVGFVPCVCRQDTVCLVSAAVIRSQPPGWEINSEAAHLRPLCPWPSWPFITLYGADSTVGLMLLATSTRTAIYASAVNSSQNNLQN